MDEFNIEIGELDNSKTADRRLIKLFEYYFHLNKRVENPEQATVELIETFMAVVRSHNNLRRNWHPKESIECDASTLSLLNKVDQKTAILDELNKAITISSNGEEVVQKKSFEKIANRLVKKINKSTKGSHYSELESIVRRIVKYNPHAKYKDIIYEMKSDQNKYDILSIDDYEVEISIPQSSGKTYKSKVWKLSTINNILTKIKKS